VNGEDIKRVVNCMHVADDFDGFLTKDARDCFNDKSLGSVDKATRSSDRDKAFDGAGDKFDEGRFAVLDALPECPEKRGHRGGDMRDGQDHHRAAVCDKLRASVEAESASVREDAAAPDPFDDWRGTAASKEKNGVEKVRAKFVR